MKVCRFTLSGKTACFRMPDVNSDVYITYGHIHKVALLGLLGAVIGLDGYGQKLSVSGKPVFYEELQNLQVSIFPKVKTGMFLKKTQCFTNTTGFSNTQQSVPCTQMVREQWLEHPEWEIMFLLDSPIAEKIADFLQERKCVYQPYLGKTEHVAVITDVCVEDITSSQDMEIPLECLVPAEQVISVDCKHNADILYQEELPIRLDDTFGLYQLTNFVYTDGWYRVQSAYMLANGRYVLFY